MASKSSTEEGRNYPETVLVGRIRRPHGVRGEVLVEPLSDVPDRLGVGSRLLLIREVGAGELVEVCGCRPHRSGLLLRFKGWEDRDRVEPLRGASLEVERSRVPQPAPGSYYFYQLVGCSCRDAAAGDLGTVVELMEDGGGILLSVRRGSTELLIPFVRDFVREIDVAAGRIELELPPGLVETCVSRS
jgi:16S rRNA processing protein RimM